MHINVVDKIIGNIYGEPVKRELAYRKTYRYLEKYMDAEDVEIGTAPLEDTVKVNNTMWVLWYQGLENAPLLVKKCIESMVEHKPENFDIVILTQENLENYIKMPVYIMDKFKKGIISKTHLSDLIRLELLNKYGGCWGDATVYCSGDIPECMVSGELFVFKWSIMDVSVRMMSSWWMYARKGQNIIRETRTLLFSYWKKEKNLSNYFLLHIAFAKVVNANSFNKLVYSEIPYFNNSDPHILWGAMGSEYDMEKWDIIRSRSNIHKLSYKRRFIRGDIDTFYEEFIKGRLV